MRVQSLGQKDPLEKKMVTHSSILAWKTPWTEEFGGLRSMGCKELEMTYQLNTQARIRLNTPPPKHLFSKGL